MGAFQDMIETRETRLRRAPAARGRAARLRRRRASCSSATWRSRTSCAPSRRSTTSRRWAPRRSASSGRASSASRRRSRAPPDTPENAELRARLALVKGVLFFRLNDAYGARLWQEHRGLKDLNLALHEAQSRWIRVERARKNVPANTGEFAARVAALKQRIDALQTRLAAAEAAAERLPGAGRRAGARAAEGPAGRLPGAGALCARAPCTTVPPVPRRRPDPARPPAPAAEGRRRRDDRRRRGPRSRRNEARAAHCAAGPWRWRWPALAAALACARRAARRPPTIGGSVEARRSRCTRTRRPMPAPPRRWRTTATSSSCRIPIRSCAPRRCAASVTSTSMPGRWSAWSRRSPRSTCRARRPSSSTRRCSRPIPTTPRNDQVLYQLARAYETTGQPEPALATLDRIVQKYPQSPQHR